MKIKNEKKALQMFCSEDTYFRKQLTRPFINSVYDGKVIATDGYVLLIADRKLLRCKYETDTLKIPHQSYKPISIPISFKAIDDAYNQLELVPEGSVFIMHHTYFDARRVCKVVEALRLMGFEQMTWVGESTTGMNWFDVCDGLQLVLMPMANTCNFKQEIRIEMED